MEVESNNCITHSQNSRIQTIIRESHERDTVPKEERQQLVLNFMARHELALPPRAIFRNLRLQHNATFARRSLVNYLDELVDDGLLMRVQPEKLEDREIVAANGSGYYLITDAGYESAAPDEL
jgi:hypothetical protein